MPTINVKLPLEDSLGNSHKLVFSNATIIATVSNNKDYTFLLDGTPLPYNFPYLQNKEFKFEEGKTYKDGCLHLFKFIKEVEKNLGLFEKITINHDFYFVFFDLRDGKSISVIATPEENRLLSINYTKQFTLEMS